ncbi:UNVERIFIED_CONTAM: hypothetical protein Sindi_0958100 [Sesamum indicum]
MLNAAIWNVRGVNKRDHQLVVKHIVDEFRLQFLGLFETRTRINNVVAIQSYLLPHWKWFVDYGLIGNRIWIAWNENSIDVEVVNCGTQFIHCIIYIRSLHESVAITVIYGATEVAERRELWNYLETIAMQSVDIPWLIGGDFNAVRDLSEICAASGDIRMAMEEFNGCVQNAGLLPLPMQGEWYTWHNCSASPWNLWKRLDQMLINDRWMARFPTSFYTSLTPCTSDHSPLVLYGDNQQQYGGMFRFDNYLTQSPDFIPSVQRIWQHHIIGVPMYALEHCCRIVLAKAAKLEQIMLQQRAKMQWMKGGDQCSRVFFSDVKQAVFDIAEDKAPGPDGYSSGFFKASWPIIGQEVSLAVLEFFNTGRILKQINTTLLALIPKVALKVDIRKAYDTVEWDFLIAAMELYGFPSTFVKWIEACITTPSYSVGLNGKPHGFFRGARGLRQGDPISPYLFVIVMEVLHLGFLQLIDQDELFSFHWKCDAARVFQLGFADDLLLFCRADVESIGVLKNELDRFAEW